MRLCLITFFSRGHLLIEDLPGLGKTTLAIAMSRAMDLSFGRIQCTSDLLPTDITGLSVYNRVKGEFEFHPGPIFNNVVLCDEINRTTPKTQSALLEAMGERQVTVDGKTYRLPEIFCVIATQNPTDQFGTFPLPHSQLDRFTLRMSIGYPPLEAEQAILRAGDVKERLQQIQPVMGKEEILKAMKEIELVYVSEKIIRYVLAIAEKTRKSDYFLTGLSTRGALVLITTAKTNAYLHRRHYVIPEDVKELVPYVVPHRVVFREAYEHMNKEALLLSLLEEIKTPA